MVTIEEKQDTSTEDANQPNTAETVDTAAAADNAASQNNNGERHARLGELPLEWTQLGQGEDGEAPMNVIRYPSEVSEFTKEDTEIMVVGTAGQKITRIGKKFYEECNPQLKQLVLRSHLIKTMEGLEGLKELELLELYDNMVDGLQNLNDGENGTPGRTLITLDMSYNVIRDMKPVEFCPNLTELYLANNKLKSLAGLKGLSKLRKIDLGANRIRVMDEEELSGLVNLEELWLGKNKIEEIRGLEKLTKLRRLDVQSNRLTKVENLETQAPNLEELYLSHNAITSDGAAMPTGLAQEFPKLNVLDLCRNRVISTAPFAHLTALEELWLSGNKIATFDDVQPLSELGKHDLETVYLEYNPVADEFEYRKKLAELIPSLKQIDATIILGLAAHGISPPTRTTGAAQTAEEEMRRMQGAAVALAHKQAAEKK